ncbi:OmpA/MotB family protein [Candidatus Nitrospira bockiana]
MRILSLFLFGAALLAGCSGRVPSFGGSSASPPVVQNQYPADDARLAALEKRVRDLEAQLAAERARGYRDHREDDGEAPRTFEELAKLFESEIEAGTIALARRDGHWTINLADELLFESGEARLKPAGIHVLKLVGRVLRSLPDAQITVGGHTDSIPIGGKLARQFRTNRDLSKARAVNAVRALEAGGVASERLAAVGYADSKPVANNATEAGRQKNRRVEIVVSPVSPD